MKKSSIAIILISLIAITSLLLISSNSPTSDQSPIEEGQLIFRMADHRIESYPSNKGVREFARLVEEKTDGQIQILVYDQNTLFTESNIVEQIAFGGIDFGRVSSLYLAEYVPLMETMLTPNMFNDADEMMAVLNHEEVDLVLKESFREEKINILSWYPGSERGIFHKESSLSYIEGDKIAVAESQVKIDEVTSLGFQAIPSKTENINSYLESNYIQGAEGDLLDYYYNNNDSKANHFTTTSWSIVPEAIIVSNTAMRRLTTKQQAIIVEAANEAALYIDELIKEQEEVAKAELTHVEFLDGANYVDNEILEKWQRNRSDEYDKWYLFIEDVIKEVEDHE